MYQEASHAMEIEPGAATDILVHLSESPFGIKKLNKIESMIGKIRLLILPSVIYIDLFKGNIIVLRAVTILSVM